jgi:uncharacterized protein YsxB (DUF464 family)
MSPRGHLQGFAAEGHAGASTAGRNTACAAATSLLRTAGMLCADRGLVEAGGAAEPGIMSMRLAAVGDRDQAWLRGVTDFLLRGLNDLAREFPREILVRTEQTEV